MATISKNCLCGVVKSKKRIIAEKIHMQSKRIESHRIESDRHSFIKPQEAYTLPIYTYAYVRTYVHSYLRTYNVLYIKRYFFLFKNLTFQIVNTFVQINKRMYITINQLLQTFVCKNSKKKKLASKDKRQGKTRNFYKY